MTRIDRSSSSELEAALPHPPAPRSLYVHVPFCVRTCPYCDFYKLAPRSPGEPNRFLAALAAEAARDLPAELRFETIFVGGGTPTELPPAELEALVKLVTGLAAPGAEITFESNPGTCGRAGFELLAGAGVNRLSIGAQTFDDRRLRVLGRVHDRASIGRAVDEARAAGFTNVNLDLIYAIPGQTLRELEDDLTALRALAPEHVSAYCLTYEPGTPFGRALERGSIDPATQEDEATMMLHLREGLGSSGYASYEVSNFARPGRRCRHNLLCWQYQRYHAIGPSAASFVGWTRTTRARDLDRWMRWAEQPHPSADGLELTETLDARTAFLEVILLGLRLDDGLSRAEVRERAGQDLDAVRGPAIAGLAAKGWLVDDGQRIKLTSEGRLLANQAVLELG